MELQRKTSCAIFGEMSGQSQKMKAAKPDTTVQDGISTFVSMKSLNVLKWHPDIVLPCLWQQI